MSYNDNYGADIFAEDDKLALTKRGKPRKRKPKEPRIYFTQDTEDAIEISTNEIEALEIDNGDIGKKIDDCKKEVRDYNDFITKNSIANRSGLNGDQISKDLEQLKSKEIELNEKFNELTELIPLLILTGKIEEVKEHLLLQESIEYNFNNSKIFRDKLDQFIELLFNKRRSVCFNYRSSRLFTTAFQRNSPY